MTIAIIINSCLSFYEKTLPPLLESMAASPNFDPSHVYVVIGDSPEVHDATFTYSNASNANNTITIRTFFRNWGNIDNNAMIWLTKEDAKSILAPYEWIFYMHDTCRVHPDFFTNLPTTLAPYATSPQSQTAAVRIHSPFSMSMGYYRLSALHTPHITNFLTDLTNHDLSTESRIKVKNNLGQLEDIVFKKLAPHVATIPNRYNVITRDETITTDATAAKRIVEYYNLPGIYKIKANYEPRIKLHLNL